MNTATIVRAALALLTDEKTRKAIGWTLVGILSPLILLIAFLCALGTGAAEHNNRMVDLCFYGTSNMGEIPQEIRGQILAIQSSFSSLDSAVTAVNAIAEGSELDPMQLKAVYYVLCSERNVNVDRFAACFYRLKERTRTVREINEDGEVVETKETYTVAIPVSLNVAYTNLSAILGREITAEERENIQYIYGMVTGSGGEGYEGIYLRGNEPSVELDISTFSDPTSKNADDLVAYAVHAWKSGWGYVWGTFGNVLTESILDYKIRQYPDGVGRYEGFIRANWLGGRTTDCVGLIKGYGWLDPDSLSIKYGTNGMPDIGANAMYHNATVSGLISTMPDTPGLAVWKDGHIGVYIGNGEVVEASSTRKGVIKTQLAGRGWTHWLEVPYINYN